MELKLGFWTGDGFCFNSLFLSCLITYSAPFIQSFWPELLSSGVFGGVLGQSNEIKCLWLHSYYFKGKRRPLGDEGVVLQKIYFMEIFLAPQNTPSWPFTELKNIKKWLFYTPKNFRQPFSRNKNFDETKSKQKNFAKSKSKSKYAQP